MALRGIRGAICVAKNSKGQIVSATKQLLKSLIQANAINPEDVASIIFSTTYDLDAEFPAVAARALGYINTPLLCTHEMKVPKSLGKCIRVLMHVNLNALQEDMRHIYIGKAKVLRPDIKSNKKSKAYLS